MALKDLMSILEEDFSVRRFRKGGPAENPEADYFLTEEDKAENPS